MKKSKALIISLLLTTVLLVGCGDIIQKSENNTEESSTIKELAVSKPDFDFVAPEDISDKTIVSVTELRGKNGFSDYIIIHDSEQAEAKVQVCIPGLKSDLASSAENNSIILYIKGEQTYLVSHWASKVTSPNMLDLANMSDADIVSLLQTTTEATILHREKQENRYIVIGECKDPENELTYQTLIIRDADAEVVYLFSVMADNENYNKDEITNIFKEVKTYKYENTLVENDSE